MYIWPFGRPTQHEALTTTAVRYSQTTPHTLSQEHKMYEHKMEKEKAYTYRPALPMRSTSFRVRGCMGSSRRCIAIAFICMILLCNVQPLFKAMTKPLPQWPQSHSTKWLGSPAGQWAASKETLPYASEPAVAHLNNKLVPLEAHIMSKCPDAQDCLVDFIVPAMQKISDKVNFTLSFIGDVSKDETVHCKHGEDECLGNMLMLCAAKLYPDPKISLGFSTCMIRDYEAIPQRTLVQGCALEHALDFDELNNCMSEEGEGLELLKSSIRRSAAKDVQYSCTVRLNEKTRCIRDDGKWIDCDDGSEPGDLIRDVEALYT